jgi:hypothetical protein
MIALGKLPAPSPATPLWGHYHELLDAAARAGVTGVRLDVAWSRIEPRDGVINNEALTAYGEALAYGRALGLVMTVGAIDAAWPSWLGLEAWLLPWTIPCAVRHLHRLAHLLGDYDGLVPFVDAEQLVRGYLDAAVAPWRRGATDDAREVRAQLATIRTRAGQDDHTGQLMAQAAGDTYGPALLAGSGPLAADRGLLTYDGGWVLA